MMLRVAYAEGRSPGASCAVERVAVSEGIVVEGNQGHWDGKLAFVE